MIFTGEVKAAIAISAIGIGCIICRNLIKSVKANYISEVGKHMAETRDPDIGEFEERVKNLKDRVSDITGKESRDISDKVSKFKKNINYEDKVSGYKKSIKDGVNEFKTFINSDSRIKEAQAKLEKAIDDYKTNNAYDIKMNSLKKKISDAEEEYSNKKSWAKRMSDKDDAKEFKRIAKEKRNKIIDAAKKDIKEMEDSFNEFKMKEESICESDISAIKKQISDKETHLKMDADERIKILDDQVSDYRDQVSGEVFAKRSENDQLTIDEYNSCKEELDDIHREEACTRAQLLKDASFSEKLALYLHNKGWKQWHVIAVGSIPVVAAGYLVAKYVGWLVNFSKAVATGEIIGGCLS